MPRHSKAFLLIILMLSWSMVAAQVPVDRSVQRPALPAPCPYPGVTTLAYWRCQAASGPRPAIMHAISRRDLPRDALHISMRAGKVWVSAGVTDSVHWHIGAVGRPIETQGLPDELFHVGPAGDRYEIRSDFPQDSFPGQRFLNLEVFVPSDLKALQIDAGNGDVSVGNFSGEITITVEKGFVTVSQSSGPALIEDRDGSVRLYLGATRYGPESVLKSSMNVLGRNGDIEVIFPASTKANLDVEAHQGTIVDAPTGFELRPPRGDTVPVQRLPPGLGLRDNELRTLHRALNGGGPTIKLVALTGNITLHQFIGLVKSP